MATRIPVSEPLLGELESRYVNDALSKGAISGFFGDYLSRFEAEFAKYCDCTHGVAVTNGTTALHLALVAVGVKAGDEVLVSSLTNMASFFAVLYIGAKPVPIDIEPDTLNLDPSQLEKHVSPKTRAIMVVHLFGHPVDMDPVLQVAARHGLKVVEDCAEAHGATYRGRKVGGIGDAGCFSFYANKIITTGEGGMVTFRDGAMAERARSLKGLAFGKRNKFMHEDIGYNYRMTNLQAALGLAQFQRIEEFVEMKREIARKYSARLRDIGDLQLPIEKGYARNVYWMYHVVLRGRHAGRRDEIMRKLDLSGVDTRETFIPYNLQEIFIERGWTRPDACPIANSGADSGFYLPSGAGLTDPQIDHVAEALRQAVGT
jgi:perosamine synthetase